MYIRNKNVNFYRIGFYDNILDADKLSMYIEIGYGKNDEITVEDVQVQLKLTLENLHKLGIIDDETRLEEHSTIIMDPHMCISQQRLKRELESLKKEKRRIIFIRSEDMARGHIALWKIVWLRQKKLAEHLE